jgi:hypothetical protein
MKKLCSLYFSLLFLLSCGQEKPAQQKTEITQGGSDTGGSHSINNKPIESYIIHIRELQEYRVVLKPILSRIQFLNAAFSQKLENSIDLTRDWYLVPISLEKLSNAQIAIPLNAATDQFASHMAKSIWISQEMYDRSKNVFESAKHFLHEMVMSLRVDQNLRDKKAFLSQADYEDIRAVTDYLYTSAYSTYELNQILALRGFLGNSAAASQNSEVPIDFLAQNLDIFTPEKLISFLASRKTEQLPGILYYYQSYNKTPIGRCSYKFDEATKTIQLDTDFTPKNSQDTLSLQLQVDSVVKNGEQAQPYFLSVAALAKRNKSQTYAEINIYKNQVHYILFIMNSAGFWNTNYVCTDSVHFLKEAKPFSLDDWRHK